MTDSATTRADLELALHFAEDKLNDLAEQARETYRRFRDLDTQQTAKAEEVRELRRRIRETGPEMSP